MHSIKLTASLILICTLVACSSQPAYRAATGSGFGYSEQRITDNYYRVNFKARGDNSAEAKAYALRRAAELTAIQGYDWFVVLEHDILTERERPRSQIGAGVRHTTVQDCSLLGCRSRTVQQPDYQAELSGGSREQVEVALEIRMGKGVMPDNATAYPIDSSR